MESARNSEPRNDKRIEHGRRGRRKISWEVTRTFELNNPPVRFLAPTGHDVENSGVVSRKKSQKSISGGYNTILSERGKKRRKKWGREYTT